MNTKGGLKKKRTIQPQSRDIRVTKPAKDLAYDFYNDVFRDTWDPHRTKVQIPTNRI